MQIPLGRKATEAAETVKAAARDASVFAWAVLALAAGALLIGCIALVKASSRAAA